MPVNTLCLLSVKQQQRRKDEQIYSKRPQWTREVKRLKGHFGHDPCSNLTGIWSVLPPPHQLAITGHVTPVDLAILLYTSGSLLIKNNTENMCIKYELIWFWYRMMLLCYFPVSLPADTVWPFSQSLQRPSEYCFWMGSNKQTITREEDVFGRIASWWWSV